MKNYTTKIESKKTIGEIAELLTENDAKTIQLVNDEDRTMNRNFWLNKICSHP